MGALRPVPDTPPRALGMIRVSKERDGMMSPDVQRAAIADYCAARGYDVVDWVEGIDQSGSRAKSAWWPRLEQSVARVQAGEFDVIVVWKFSRTARHRLKWAVALDGVESAGGAIESATEQIDVSTSMGKFTRGMMGELNAFEAERIGEGWKEVHASRLAEGRTPQGTAKYGYVWNKAEQVHEPDPATAPVLTQLYQRYLAGESFHALVRWLNGSGHRTRNGGLWADTALRRVLDSGFAAGLIPWNGEKYPGIHEPLIDAVTWQAYQDSRSRRRAAPARRERSQYVLSGLVRCASCGGPMVASPQKPPRQISLRCSTAKGKGREACPGGYIAMRVVVAEVLDWLEDVATNVDAAARARKGVVVAQVSREAEIRRLSRLIAGKDDQLTQLSLQLSEGLTTRDRYIAARDVVLAQQAALAEQLEDLGRQARSAVSAPDAVAKGLLEGWLTWTVAQRRELLGTLIDTVLVRTGDRSGVAGVKGGASNAWVKVVQSWPEE